MRCPRPERQNLSECFLKAAAPPEANLPHLHGVQAQLWVLKSHFPFLCISISLRISASAAHQGGDKIGGLLSVPLTRGLPPPCLPLAATIILTPSGEPLSRSWSPVLCLRGTWCPRGSASPGWAARRVVAVVLRAGPWDGSREGLGAFRPKSPGPPRHGDGPRPSGKDRTAGPSHPLWGLPASPPLSPLQGRPRSPAPLGILEEPGRLPV